MGYLERGYITLEELQEMGFVPPPERVRRGPVAFIECPQEIPCNPCVEACPYGAISMEGINGLPRLDFDKCNGCGRCVRVCPGLAIFIVNARGKYTVWLPHEMLPLPERGSEVALLDRSGEEVGRGRVVAVMGAEDNTRSSIVVVEVPEERHLYHVRAMRVV